MKFKVIRIRLKHGFGIVYHLTLPPLGEQSPGLRILTETWSAGRNTLTMECPGTPGAVYDLRGWNPKQVTPIDDATLIETPAHTTVAHIEFPPSTTITPTRTKLTFHF